MKKPKPKTTTAKDLIERAKARSGLAPKHLPKELRAHLIEIVKHNATAKQSARVLNEEVRELALTWGVKLSVDGWAQLKRELEKEIAS